MNDAQKVLVVDDGARSPDEALSTDLAELGFSSVTTSLEAADDVLQVIARPAAIFLQLPSANFAARRDAFSELGRRLRQSGLQVFEVQGHAAAHAEAISAWMQGCFGPARAPEPA